MLHLMLHLVPPVLHMVLLQHQHRQWIKARKLQIPLQKPGDKHAALRLLTILESPLDSAQRRKITTLKRDEKIPSFSQVDGLPSSPTAERKAEEEMEEVEEKEEEKK